jgi:hypothetical protein
MVSANLQKDDVNNQKPFENTQTALVSKENRPSSLPVQKLLSKNNCEWFVTQYLALFLQTQTIKEDKEHGN